MRKQFSSENGSCPFVDYCRRSIFLSTEFCGFNSSDEGGPDEAALYANILRLGFISIYDYEVTPWLLMKQFAAELAGSWCYSGALVLIRELADI